MERIELFKAYFTQESKYYADKLERIEQGKKTTFNFWAGFLGLIWFFYRKMYVQGFIILLSTLFLAFIIGIIIAILNPYDISNVLYNQIIMWILSFVTLGFIGNRLYINKSRKIISEFILKYDHDLEKIKSSMADELRLKGGTSLSSALICAGILILFQIISKIYS
jgi:hypothetical protein